jgi:aminodeoxyfutalosine synthase
MSTSTFERALTVGGEGQRLDRGEALALAEACTPDEVHRLGQAALASRQRRYGDRATYVFNLSVNPSNICHGGCRFCRYSARPDDEHAYVLDRDTILDRVEEARPVEVHIVGGMNRIWDLEGSLELVRGIRRRHPRIHIKAYTAVEMDWFARSEARSIPEVLSAFQAAGLDAMPGGGAELFSPRMRAEHCPDKLSPEGWLDVHRTAHELGISTNATMLYGLGETPAERVDHLLALRRAQDDSEGFSCFIPLAHQPGEAIAPGTGSSPLSNLAVVALARLLLDNVPHIKAYWPMIGLETAAAALSWGADDLDGTLGHERIAHAAGARTPRSVTRDQMKETIRLGGFTAVERDGRFRACNGEGGDE